MKYKDLEPGNMFECRRTTYFKGKYGAINLGDGALAIFLVDDDVTLINNPFRLVFGDLTGGDVFKFGFSTFIKYNGDLAVNSDGIKVNFYSEAVVRKVKFIHYMDSSQLKQGTFFISGNDVYYLKLEDTLLRLSDCAIIKSNREVKSILKESS